MTPRGLGKGPLGTMPLGGGMYYLSSQIDASSSDVFRRFQVKRRLQSTGLYEANWQDLTEFVKKWGSVEMSIDDIRLNKFRFSGVNVTCRNDVGKFNDETNSSSHWYGYMTRYRSLIRIQAGYSTPGGELPSDSTQGIFVLTDEIEQDANRNEVVLRCSSLQSIFDEVRATDINFGSLTALSSEFMTRIRDHTDGVGTFVFRQFITSTAWTIQATTTQLVLNTATSLDGISAWELMEKLAESEGFVLFINRTGGIEFRNRDPRTTTSMYSFRGQGFPNQNIISLGGEVEAVNKLYTYVRYKYLQPDTSTSFVTAGTTTAVNSSNTAWKYGQRTYEMENLLSPSTATAQGVANAFLAEFDDVKKEITFDAKFHPEMQVLDRIDFSYRSYDIAFNSLWDVMVWDTDIWSREGNNFDYEGKAYKILSRRTDLDRFVTSIKAREI